MIKVPGTAEGADATKRLIASGINVNISGTGPNAGKYIANTGEVRVGIGGGANSTLVVSQSGSIASVGNFMVGANGATGFSRDFQRKLAVSRIASPPAKGAIQMSVSLSSRSASRDVTS